MVGSAVVTPRRWVVKSQALRGDLGPVRGPARVVAAVAEPRVGGVFVQRRAARIPKPTFGAAGEHWLTVLKSLKSCFVSDTMGEWRFGSPARLDSTGSAARMRCT